MRGRFILVVIAVAMIVAVVSTAGASNKISKDQGRRLAGPFCVGKTFLKPFGSRIGQGGVIKSSNIAALTAILRAGVVRSVAVTQPCRPWENRKMGLAVPDPDPITPGTPGPKGDTGPAGPAGATGATGAPGAKGEIGATGPAGAKGATGANGANGAPGAKGEKGDTGATGAPGKNGENGAPGAKGEKGDTGAPGAKGDTGATGAPGKDGKDGAKGDTGPPGPKGDTGAPGKDGKDGKDGAPGKDEDSEGHVWICADGVNGNGHGFGGTDPAGPDCNNGSKVAFFVEYSQKVTLTP